MTDRYLGIPSRDEILAAATRRLSCEDLRAMKFYHEHQEPTAVKRENGTRKVTFGMKVCENVYTGRLLHLQPTAIRRTERIARKLKDDPKLDLNSRAVMEYLWERCWAEDDKNGGSAGLPEKYRPGGARV